MFVWKVRARCDWLEEFAIDVFEFHLETSDIIEAITYIVADISSNYTIIQIEREV